MMTALGSQASAITGCITPVGAAKCVVGAVGGAAAKQGFEEVVAAFADGAQSMLKAVATFWTKVPDPQLDPSTSAGGQVASLAANQTYLVAVLATFGFVVGVGRLVWHNRVAQSAKELLRGLAVMTVAASLVTAVFTIFLQAGNGYSDWILQRATGENSAGDAFTAIIKKSIGSSVTGVDSGLGAWFLLFLLLILGSLMQVLFMVVRGGVIYVLAVFLPLLAADSFSEEGWGRFKRALMLMFAFAIYKPVAATIYATGFKVLQAPGDPDKTSASLMNGIFGLTILVLAAVALPSLIKFLVPVAAMGSSGAFSGGAAVGAIAAGAAMVAGAGATGGGSAAATGASSIAGTGSGGGGGGGGTGGGGAGGGDAKGGGASPTGGVQSSGSGAGPTGGGESSGNGAGSDSGAEPSAEAPGAGSGDSAGGDDMPSGGTDGGSGSEGAVPTGGAAGDGASSGDTPAAGSPSGGSPSGGSPAGGDGPSGAPSGGTPGSSSPSGGSPSGGSPSSGSPAGGDGPSGAPSSGTPGSGSPSGGMPGGAPASPAAPSGASSSSSGSGGSGGAAQAGSQVAQQVAQLAQGAVPDGADEVSE